MVIEGDIIYIHDISPSATEGDIAEMFSRLGFRAHALTKISVLREEKTALVKLSHSHLAQAAFSLLRQQSSMSIQAEPAWGGNPQSLESDLEICGAHPEIIDLTVDDDELPAPLSLRKELYNPYEGLDPEIYDDPMESDSDNDSDEGATPSRALSLPLTNPSNSTDETHHNSLDRYGLGLLNATARDMNQTVSKSSKPRTSPLSRKQGAQSEGRSLLRHRFNELAQDLDKSGITIVPIPKSAYNHPRRVLISESAEAPLMTVSMRGDLQFFHRTQRYRLSKYSIPNQDAYRHVVDAVIAGDQAIVAYSDGPSQVSMVSLKSGRTPTLVDLDHKPHRRVSESGPIAAVNCLAVNSSNGQTNQFYTGGFDKRIRCWSVAPGGEFLRTSSSEIFAMGTIPEALACNPKRSNLLIATSKKLLNVDLNHLTSRPTTFKMSNAIHQIHLLKQAPDVIILEVDNLDFQIQVYDQRKKGGFDRVPDSYFGARHGNGVPARFSRGGSRLNEFAKGFDDGTVRIWDYRNTKAPVLLKAHRDLGSITHTSYLNRDIVSYGKQGLVFLMK
ncbi:hypothetical protein CPB83DRAFT_228172 [Crepidotus variabilis]|uniref:Uncharacterized protein n=1 Tax=Crepidotus variabilis TaxID=179855 RepID=A0A9P6ETP7_9AGAR|nr:hypothetical protein CPB83DRAFT_228172 [Crepidotus variabilis]